MAGVIRRAVVAALVAAAAMAVPASGAGEPTTRTWHGNQIHLYGAQAAGRSGAGVVVAVLDGWIDRSHPDFEGRVLAGVDCRSGTCRPGLTQENCGAHHGTHVAGTVAASNLGVAPKATVLPVQVLSADSKGECTGTPAAVAAGIDYAVAHGARVLNLSLGPDNPGSTNPVIPTAVHRAAQAGAVVVFSAGNADLPVSQSYGSDALVVAATGPSGRLASYSQYGAGVTLAAPGGQPDSRDDCEISDCVLSLYPGNQLAVAAGTSMAAPHVSGLAALLFGQDPHRSRDAVVNRIESTAHALSGAGYGLIDVRAALGVRVSSPTPAPSRTATRKPSPRPVVKPRPTASATRTPARPSPTASPTPSPELTTAPPETVSPTPSSLAVVPRSSSDGDVPWSVAAVAGLLVLLAGGAVAALGRR